MLLDLGISSPQFDDAHRGFRPEQDGPLDLRFDQSKGVSAHEYLSSVERSELARVLKLYGDGKPHNDRLMARLICAFVKQPRRFDVSVLLQALNGNDRAGRDGRGGGAAGCGRHLHPEVNGGGAAGSDAGIRVVCCGGEGQGVSGVPSGQAGLPGRAYPWHSLLCSRS